MHEKGFANQDLKLQNILVDAYFNTKIVDFGFAISTSPDVCKIFDQGTQLYCSPEKIMLKPSNAFKNDIFSLGVILFQLVNRSNPYMKSASIYDPIYSLIIDKQRNQYWKEIEQKLKI